MARPRNKYDWKNIDPILFLACMAPSRDQFNQAIDRLIARHEMTRNTLMRRLYFIGGSFLSPDSGAEAMERYERRMLLAIRWEKLYPRIRFALMTKLERMRDRQEAVLRTSLSLTEAAKILCVRPETFRRWVEDLRALQLDEHGRVPLSELRRFMTSEWRWLVPAVRLRGGVLKQLNVYLENLPPLPPGWRSATKE